MRGQATRDQIIEAADDLFYREGYAHTSFADIAAAVQISRGNFYYHFKMKDEILDAVIVQRLTNTQQCLKRWESEGEGPADHIRSFIRMTNLLGPGLADEVAYLRLAPRIANDDEIPGLHEAHRGRVMGGGEEPRQYRVGNRAGQELAAYVAAGENGPIDGVARRLVEIAGGNRFGLHRSSPCVASPPPACPRG